MKISFIFQKDNDASRGWLSEDQSGVFDPEVIERLKNETIYQYQENVPEQESLWDMFWNWVGRGLDYIFDALFDLGKPGWWGTFVELLPYFFIALVIGLLVYLFYRNNPLRKSNQVNLDNNEVLLHNLNKDEQKLAINQLIENAKQQKNYQLLIRYQYIKILNELNYLQLIQFKSDKTNSEYYHELKDKVFLNDFKQLTYYYEYSWYGDFEVSEELYHKYENLLQYIHQQVNQNHG